MVITNSGKVYSDATSYVGNNATSTNNQMSIIGGAGKSSLWSLGGNILYFINSSEAPNNRMVIDGAGAEGSAVVTNIGTLVFGRSTANSSITITNGGRLFMNGEVQMGSTYYDSGYDNSTNNTITVVGGTTNSTFYGSSNSFDIGYAERPGAAENRVIIGSGGIMTNVGRHATTPAYDFVIGHGQSVAAPVLPSRNNSLTVQDGGRAYLLRNLSIGLADAGAVTSVSNSLSVANGGFVNIPGYVRVGAIGNAGTNGYNSLTVTSGGQLVTGADSAIGYSAGSAASLARGNFAFVSGAGSVWNLSGTTLRVGQIVAGTSTNNSLSVDSGGAVTNAGSIIVLSTNTVGLGNGGNIYATSMTMSSNSVLAVTLNDALSSQAGKMVVSGNLILTNAVLDITDTYSEQSSYLIATYGTRAGSFGQTNGLPAGWSVDYQYGGFNQIMLVASNVQSRVRVPDNKNSISVYNNILVP
jgi:hypothetical protein